MVRLKNCRIFLRNLPQRILMQQVNLFNRRFLCPAIAADFPFGILCALLFHRNRAALVKAQATYHNLAHHRMSVQNLHSFSSFPDKVLPLLNYFSQKIASCIGLFC